MIASVTPAVPVVLRVAWDSDGPFLSALFAACHAPMLALSGLPQATIDGLVAMQFRGQTESYRMRFPNARHVIVESGAHPVGRLIVAAEARDLYIVDIEIHPDAQRQGFGTAAVSGVQREAQAGGLGVRALVAPGNGPSLAMFHRRGFIETGRSAEPSLELRWVA